MENQYKKSLHQAKFQRNCQKLKEFESVFVCIDTFSCKLCYGHYLTQLADGKSSFRVIGLMVEEKIGYGLYQI